MVGSVVVVVKLQNFYCEVNLYIYVYRHSVHRG
jgi:hypothetical protein